MTTSFDRVAEIYDRTRSHPPHVMNRITEVLKEELEGSGRVLDAGAGTGRFACPLQDKGLDIVAADVSEKMLAKAREKGTKHTVIADARALPFKDSSFDATLSIHLLHLVKEWESALREILRVTRVHLLTITYENTDPKANPYGLYRDMLMKHGYSYDHPGFAEPRLKETIEPVKTRFIISYENKASESIGFLRDKVFAVQWNVPDEPHEKAMAELKRKFDENAKYTNTVYLYVWNISEIKKHLDALAAEQQDFQKA
ncbi:MAG: methyltransferase domain-containing protein [Thermoplasmata archaeon]|nr:methyltransferase domain-containing protein [Thermoplasmata archaeon]